MRYGARMSHVWSGARVLLAAFAATGCLAFAACSDSDSEQGTEPIANSPVPTYIGPGALHTIEETTQLHLKGVGIGVGNIWEEEYTPTGGVPSRGLTAMLFISVEADPSQNLRQRVHPGQELTVPGYRLQVLSVEERRIHLAVVEVPE